MYKKLVIFLILSLVIFRFVTFNSWGSNGNDLELENISSQFSSARLYISQAANSVLPQPQAGLLTGIVFGIKSELPSDFKKALTTTSTVHIVVASGQNLTLLSGFVMSLASLFGRKKLIFIDLALIFFYSVLTGLQIPIIRAAIMISMALLGQLLGKEVLSLRILAITGAVMLLYNPNWLFSVSFQLSFLSTIGVMVVAPEFVKKLTILPSIIREDTAMTVAAQLMTWPVIASSFHQVSLIGLLVNILVLWTVPVIMITGALTILITLISPVLGSILVLVPEILLTYFVDIITFFNSAGYIYIGKVSIIVWFGYYLILGSIILALMRQNRDKEDNDKNKIRLTECSLG